MGMRLSAYSIALASILTLGACVEDDSVDSGVGDRQDDIINYDKVTYLQAGEQTLKVNLQSETAAIMPMRPTVKVTEYAEDDELKKELTIQTPWVFHEYANPIDIWVTGKYDSPDDEDRSEDTKYGFQLEVLSNDNTEWIPMAAGNYPGWAWQYLEVRKAENNTYILSGQTARYYDKANAWFGGPIAEFEPNHVVKAYGNDLEFRISVIPLYSFWNWETANNRYYGLDALLHNKCGKRSSGGGYGCAVDPVDL